MSEEGAVEASPKMPKADRTTKVVLWSIAAMFAVLAVFTVVRIVSEQRADDRRTDEFYCSLEGVGPFDRAPNTGDLCVELIGFKGD